MNILVSNKKSIFWKGIRKINFTSVGKTGTFVTRAVIGSVTKQSLKKNQELPLIPIPLGSAGNKGSAF